MTVAACIADLRAKGQLEARRAQLFLDIYNDLEQSYAGTMGRAAAMAQASADTMKALQADLARRKRLTALQVTAQKGILANMERMAREGVDLDITAVAHFDHDERVRGVSNIEARRRAVLGKLHGMMAEVLETFDRNVLGRVRNPARLVNVVREAFGEDTGDLAAKELAAAWGKAADYARQRFNMAGGQIGRLENWGLPQAHDGRKVKAAGFEAWRDALVPMLDLSRMVDEATGLPFTAMRLEAMLRDTYEAIVTEGWSRRPLGGGGRGMIANQRAERRFLAFKDADTWLDYQARFGVGDSRGAPDAVFDTMMGHMDGMARDIAAMEILGPNPAATVRWLADLVEKGAATDALPDGRIVRADSRARAAGFQMRTMFDLFNGDMNRPVNAQMARGFSAIRSWMTASKLGGAAISALTDIGFQWTTRAFNGLPVMRAVSDYLTYMLPKVRAGEKAVAVRSGLLAEEAAGRLAALWRYHDEFNTPALAQRLANGVMQLSGLSRWTQVGRWLFGMEYMGHLADNAGRSWADLDDTLRGRLEFYGIGEDRWELIRQTPLNEANGSALLRPDDVAARTDLGPGQAEELSDLLLEMIQSETRFAVPEAGLRSRAAMTGASRAGTFSGELWRSMMQFKAFPVSIAFTHLMRAIHGRGGLPRAGYVAHLVIGTTALGALALQIKQVLAGKDPQPMDNPRFWTAAAMQGGGLGIYGDFLFADQNRYGGGLAATLAGPTIGSAEGFLHLTAGNVQEMFGGKEFEDTNGGRELVRFLRANTPGASLWYSRLAMDRLIWDEMQQMMDPDYAGAVRRMERTAEREFGQEFFWAPDENAPDRAPDFSNAMGEE